MAFRMLSERPNLLMKDINSFVADIGLGERSVDFYKQMTKINPRIYSSERFRASLTSSYRQSGGDMLDMGADVHRNLADAGKMEEMNTFYKEGELYKKAEELRSTSHNCLDRSDISEQLNGIA